MYQIRTILVILFVLVGFIAKSQTTNGHEQTVSQLTQNMTYYAVNSRSEKLYLHIDKECCQPGDTLFFKGYLVSAVTNVPVDYSRYMYVELVDRRELVYIREKITKDTILNAFCGYLPMSENLHQGEYFLRAYTYNMQNEQEEYIFRKRIRVVNPHDNRITCKMDIENLRNGKRILKVHFINAQNERYENVAFQYKIPGETPDTSFLVGTTGYNGLCRIDVNNPKSDHIWISFDNNGSWSFEKYLPIPGAVRNYEVQFFPEGGALVANAKQQIAFKSVGTDGLGISVKGKVKDSKGAIVTTFESNGLGMGSFYIETKADEQYIAICKDTNGQEREFELPTPDDNAISIALISNKESVRYNVLASGTQENYTDKYMLIHSRGIPLAIAPIHSMQNRDMDLSNAPQGIIHFAIIDVYGNVYSNRLWFHRKDSHSTISLEEPLKRVKPREDATMQLCFTNIPNETLGNYSLSVTNNGQMPYNQDGMTIVSNLLLTSDLKGYVENPGYYFNGDVLSKDKDLDYLLLTQGWSKFSLQHILQDSYSRTREYYLERGQFLSGRVKNYWGKRPLYDNSIILIGSNGIARELQTDSSGYFIEDDLWYDQDTRFVVQALTPKGKSNLELYLDEPKFRISRTVEPLLVCCGDVDFYKRYGKDYIFADNGERIQTMGEVKVHGGPMSMRRAIMQEYIQRDIRRNFQLGLTNVYWYGSLPWAAKLGFTSSAYRPYAEMLHAASGNMKLVTTPGGNAFNEPTIDLKNLNNVDDDLIQAWEALGDVEKISNGESAKTLVASSNYKPKGIIGVSFPMMQGKDITSDVVGIPIFDLYVPHYEVKFNMQTIVPFAPQKRSVQFYKPSYDVATDLLKDVVDEKVTRYWNPNVKFTANGEFEFDFPTAGGDGNQSYTITIEGITDNGTPIHHSFQYSL